LNSNINVHPKSVCAKRTQKLGKLLRFPPVGLVASANRVSRSRVNNKSSSSLRSGSHVGS